MHVLRSRIAALLDRFLRDRRGVVAIIFGLSLLPLLLAIGVSVDYSRAGATKNRLQGAADTAALALAHEVGELNQDELVAAARRIIEANFGSVQGATVGAVNVIEGDGEVTVNVTADVPTTFAAVMRMENIPVSVSADAVWGGNPIELALVLDVTGSMVRDPDGKSNQKLATLKTAVQDMFDVLEDPTAIAEGAIQVGIVPFNTQVRLAMSNSGANWLREHKNGYDETWARGDYWSGALDAWRGYKPKNWNGCVFDRDQPHDATDAAATTAATRYPEGPCISNDLKEILPLTDNFSTLRNKIDSLQGGGNTNVTIGVAWGIAMLTNRAPLTEATSPGEVEGLKKIMVVLTDGDNTMNRVSGRQKSIDARTAAACSAAKDSGIEVFTIRVLEGNQDLLRNCATDPSRYFNVEDVSELLPAFEAITTKISELRLAK